MRKKTMTKNVLYAVLITTIVSSSGWGQTSDRQFRRTAIINGNQVRTVFGNWGVIGQPGEQGKRGAWKDDNNGYIGDVSPFVGAEVKYRDTSFHAVVFTPTARPQAAPRSEDPVTGKPWAFEPLGGYFGAPPNQSIAVSNNPASWPEEWPDRLSDPIDPGWRDSWNGYFGKRVSADLETYFRMDDNNFERFSDSVNNSRRIRFRPDSRDLSKKGLGLNVSVRALQWAQFLAQDNIFWLYEITNTGTTDYDRAVFGMIVGTYVGVTSVESNGEYDDDWSFYDVRENVTYTGDFDRNTSRNSRWNQRFPVGMVGYAFLESPGNPFDGIDNDGDADSSAQGQTASQFQANSFIDTTVITVGQRLVLINQDFSRVLFTVPNVPSVKVWTRGMRDSVLILPGVTKRKAEGNIVTDFLGNTGVNANAYDGIDNNFNGLIDENSTLHYRQFKQNRNPPRQILIDILRPVRYVNNLTGQGTSPLSMIDEKRTDVIDNDIDWDRDLDDVGRDGVVNTLDAGENDGEPTSGYFASGLDSGLPGEPNIDKTDVDESDQIGLSSFYYFTPAGEFSLGDDEAVWRRVAPGFFDVPLSIVNNRPERGEDGDFTYSSGYFPLLAGATERFSLALVFGGGKGGSREDDIADLLNNKKTVQKIYNANYQFPTPPEKPTLTAVAGDRQVTLYWDRRAEGSVDPVLRINDFEGYKIYKSTDPNFSDIFTITDGRGTPRGYRPLAQYDIVDSIKGDFFATGELFEAAAGYNIYLGDDTGLQHSFVDTEVENGRKYYYAIVAYDRGNDAEKIFPSENTKQITIVTTGEVTHDINVAVVTPNAKTAGYVPPENSVALTHGEGVATGSVLFNVVDQTKVTGSRYTVTFLDTQVDTVDNNSNGITDAADSTEWDRRTSFYFVRDNSDYNEQFTVSDTLVVNLKRKNLIPSTVVVKNGQGSVIAPSSYVLLGELGTVRPLSLTSMPAGKYSITYQYYPVYRSPFMQGSPFVKETKDTDIFDGVQLAFNNSWSTVLVDSLSGWSGVNAYTFSFSALNTNGLSGPVSGFKNPNDYEVQCASTIVDTSLADEEIGIDTRVPTYFRVFNRTDSSYVKFALGENNISNPASIGRLSNLDEIVLLERNPRGTLSRSWNISFLSKINDPEDTLYFLGNSDKLVLRTTKPFRQGDALSFTTVVPKVDLAKAKNELDRVRVVPNPYVTASAFEPPLPPGITSGRGQRKIDFTHLPARATVKIFTSRGDHLVTLEHEGSLEDGTLSWNLKTKENLDVAYGVYFYIVESEVGNKTGKIAIIK